MREGRIMKALSGFYYVKTKDGSVYQCRGRGVFRNQNITPLVGDLVWFESENKQEGYIMEIKSRSNELKRPPISNITQAIITTSAKEPDFNQLLLDRFLVLVESMKIKPIIFITKMDLLTSEEEEKIRNYRRQYEKIGYSVEVFSTEQVDEFKILKAYLEQEITVIAGQSGVGKSSILNMIEPSLHLKTGEISKSLGRGKHTTRHVELIEIHNGLIADTPGFSSIEFDDISSDQLQFCFPEFLGRLNDCKFRGCMHVKEPNCAVKSAVTTGEIAASRYDNYLKFLDEIMTRKPRY